MTILRSPRLRVLADGAVLPGVVAADVTSNNHYAADCYSVRLALSADPQGLAGWETRSASLIEVQIGLEPLSGWTSLVTGRLDSLEADPIGGVLTIEGRDLSAGLIEARTREAFDNQTSSDIATLLAGRHGLAAQVTTTSTPVGRYYSAGHARLTLDRFTRASSEWDLLAWLAQLEGFDVFVSGTTLYFQPAMPAAPTLVLQAAPSATAAANVSQLRLQRAMTLAGTIEVTVKSWNSQTQAACVQSAMRAGTDESQTTRSYVYVQPNLSTDEALSLAQRKLAAITEHEYVLSATMPGELALSARDTVTLIGSNSGFDQNYIVDEINRRVDMRRGFTQTIRARMAGTS